MKRVKRELKYYAVPLPVITCAASLVHHGVLRSVRRIGLVRVDLTSVPTEHLASLVSSVRGSVTIKNVSGCDLVTILDSVKSKALNISNQSLGSEETQALVQAMESHVEKVELDCKVTLDIKILMEFNGQGKCREVGCDSDTANRYREQLRAWATSRNWEVTHEIDDWFIIEGPHHNRNRIKRRTPYITIGGCQIRINLGREYY